MLKKEKNQIAITVAISEEKRKKIYKMYGKLYGFGEKKKQEFRTKLIEFGIEKALEYFEEFKEYIGK